MKPCALYFLTGSSGSGKTTLLKGVNKTVYPNLTACYSDALGVPSVEEMNRKFGGPEKWQAHNIQQWIEKAGRAIDAALVVFDVQARPSVILEEADRAGVRSIRVTLIECSHAERRRRLLEYRNQPELDSADMCAWAAFLRGQAEALHLEVIDTTDRRVTESMKDLASSIGRFAEENGICLESLRSKKAGRRPADPA